MQDKSRTWTKEACKQEGGVSDEDLRKAKVSQLHKALQVYEDVLRLEVPVHDVVVVEVLQGQHNGGNVELGQVLIHPLQHLHLHPTPNHQQVMPVRSFRD